MIFLGKKIFDESFDRFAQTYHNIRPGYPERLYKDMIEVTRMGSATRVLEVGTGTGIATAHLADVGCTVIGIEPGQNLIAIAKNGLAGRSNVTLENVMFENFSSEQLFDVVFSATAFHWLDPTAKFAKANELLKTDGHLILVWNSFCQSDTLAAKAVDQAYQRVMGVDGKLDPNRKTLKKIMEREKEILDDGTFFLSELKRYIVHYEFSPEGYTALLHTFPKIINSAPDVRNALFSEVTEAIVRHGGSIVVPVLTNLYICRKSIGFGGFLNPRTEVVEE
jgi:SAM-dependent methyltransferase